MAADDAWSVISGPWHQIRSMMVALEELICRVALGLVLEDMRYQPAVNEFVVAYCMIGRITRGNFRLPAVNA